MSAVADKLAQARQLIERGWTQGAFTRDARGRDIEGLRNGVHEIACWCMIGALRHVNAPINQAVSFLSLAVSSQKLLDWNDAPERTQAEVVEGFKRAEQIARERASA